MADAFELQPVDDGSLDRTPEIMRELVDACANTAAVPLSCSHSQQNPLSTGLKFICGDWLTRNVVRYLGFPKTALLNQCHARFRGKMKCPLGKMQDIAVEAVTGLAKIPLRLVIHIAKDAKRVELQNA